MTTFVLHGFLPVIDWVILIQRLRWFYRNRIRVKYDRVKKGRHGLWLEWDDLLRSRMQLLIWFLHRWRNQWNNLKCRYRYILLSHHSSYRLNDCRVDWLDSALTYWLHYRLINGGSNRLDVRLHDCRNQRLYYGWYDLWLLFWPLLLVLHLLRIAGKHLMLKLSEWRNRSRLMHWCNHLSWLLLIHIFGMHVMRIRLIHWRVEL